MTSAAEPLGAGMRGARGRHSAPRDRGRIVRSVLGTVTVLRAPKADSKSGALPDAPRAVVPISSAPSVTAAGSASSPLDFAPRCYTVVAGDTMSDIAGRFGLSTASVLALNGLSWKSTIYPGQVLSLNTASTSIIAAIDSPLVRFSVGPDDTLSAIAARHGLSTQAILSANGLGRDSIIHPGQQIVLPLDAAIEPFDSTEAIWQDAQSIIAVGRELSAAQGPASPDAYARWEHSARAWLAQLG